MSDTQVNISDSFLEKMPNSMQRRNRAAQKEHQEVIKALENGNLKTRISVGLEKHELTRQ